MYPIKPKTPPKKTFYVKEKLKTTIRINLEVAKMGTIFMKEYDITEAFRGKYS
jgi:hypothetical protein